MELSGLGWLAYNGEIEQLKEAVGTWVILNAIFAGVGVILARGHPISVIVGSIASPLTSLSPFLAAGWFAGYAQLKVAKPTGKDAQEFLALDKISLLWRNRVGRVLMVTVLCNFGSSLGFFVAGGSILFNQLL